VRFPGTALADQDDLLAVVDPGALGQRGDGRLLDVRVLLEAEILEALYERKARVDEPAALSALGALLHLGLEQRRQVGQRALALAGGLGVERAEARAHRGQVKLTRVRLHQRLERLLARVRAHRAPRSSS
jgi:hypothetical protein